MTSTISSDFFKTKETICNFQVPNEPAQVEDQRSFGAGGDICFFRFFAAIMSCDAGGEDHSKNWSVKRQRNSCFG